jgi:hypothetical protein
MSCNSEILINQHLSVVTRPEVLLFTRKKGLGAMFTRPLGESVHQMLWYLLALVSSINFSCEDSRKHRRGPC